MDTKKNRLTRKNILKATSILFFIFIVITLTFSVMLFIRLFTNTCSICDLYYYIAVIFSSLAFGVATLGLSVLTYIRSREADKAYEREVISECRITYSEIISTHEFIFVKEIFDQISFDYSFYQEKALLDALENGVINVLENDFNARTFLLEYVQPNTYLIPSNLINISQEEYEAEVSLITILASYTRSVLAKFSSISEVYANGMLEESEFESNFLDGILSVHLMSIILQKYYSFYCSNVKVRCDLKLYFENKMKKELSI